MKRAARPRLARTPPLLGLLLAALVPAGACARDDDGIERSQFVATYIDLRRATVFGTLDSITRDSILTAHDVTEADLRAYLDARRDDPQGIADTWREIGERMSTSDSIRADSLRADSIRSDTVDADSVSAQPDTL